MEDHHKTRNCEGISYIVLDYCPTDGTILTSNWTIVESLSKSIPIAHWYMTVHFPGLVQALQ